MTIKRNQQKALHYVNKVNTLIIFEPENRQISAIGIRLKV